VPVKWKRQKSCWQYSLLWSSIFRSIKQFFKPNFDYFAAFPTILCAS
jgi:hypothetical protein